jgi:hypothetical protein
MRLARAMGAAVFPCWPWREAGVFGCIFFGNFGVKIEIRASREEAWRSKKRDYAKRQHVRELVSVEQNNVNSVASNTPLSQPEEHKSS